MISKYDKNRTNIYIPYALKKKAKKQHINLSQFFTEMLERELAGEFQQLKIDEAEKNLDLLKSQNIHIQTKKQEQKKRSDDNYNKIVADQLREREAFRRQRKKKPREDGDGSATEG